nr:PREDICTED: probable protein S-acyltransferase 4 isoform X2 [Musa acuminata subsp. malaccensis]
MPRLRRLYQVWKGNNRFWCGGRLIFGPDGASLSLSMLLIAGPSIAFCSQVLAKILNHEMTDDDNQNRILGSPVLIVTALLTVADLAFLLLTSSRDPGIVPRNARPPDSDEAFDVTTPSMEWVSAATPHLQLPRTKDVNVDGFTVRVKFCDTCLLYRPPRASHCSICNNCVQKFDHHCPWVDQCIGVTTYENFRYCYDKKENPYNKGLLKNFKDVFFSKIPPSLNDFRSWVLEDSPEASSISWNSGINIVGSKEKIDLEMGNMTELSSNMQITNTMQDLDCTAIDDNVQEKGRHEDVASYPFAFPVVQEPTEQASTCNNQTCIRADGMIMDEMSDEESCLNDISTHVDDDGHLLET